MSTPFKQGDRVCLSQEAKLRGINRKTPPDRQGTVRTTPKTRRVSVLWDGLTCQQSYSATFLEKVK